VCMPPEAWWLCTNLWGKRGPIMTIGLASPLGGYSLSSGMVLGEKTEWVVIPFLGFIWVK